MIHAFLAKVGIAWTVTALVSPADDVLGVAVRTRNTLVEGLAWLRDAYLLQGVQGKDQH